MARPEKRAVNDTKGEKESSTRYMGVCMKRILPITCIIILVFLSVSCFPETVASEGEEPANFLMGIWHGWIAPVSLIVSLFNDNVSIYDSNNTGWWYDAGFYIAVISGFGGLSMSRKRKNKKN